MEEDKPEKSRGIRFISKLLKSKIARLIFFLTVLIIIPLSVFLAQRQQELRQHAAGIAGKTQYVVQSLIMSDGTSGKFRQCAINTADGSIMEDTCGQGWTTYNLNLNGSSLIEAYGAFSFADSNGIQYIIQSLIANDGKTSFYRKCTIDTSSYGGLNSNSCNPWQPPILLQNLSGIPDTTFTGYGAFAFSKANGTTDEPQFVIQTLIASDKHTSYFRRCEIDKNNPNNDSGIKSDSCNSWTQVDLAESSLGINNPNFTDYDAYSFRDPNDVQYVVQHLFRSDGTGISRKCTIDTDNSSGIKADSCTGWTQFTISGTFTAYGAFNFAAASQPPPAPSPTSPILTPNPTTCTTYTCPGSSKNYWCTGQGATTICYSNSSCSGSTISSLSNYCAPPAPTSAAGSFNCSSFGTQGHCGDTAGLLSGGVDCGGGTSLGQDSCSSGQMCWSQCPGDSATVLPTSTPLPIPTAVPTAVPTNHPRATSAPTSPPGTSPTAVPSSTPISPTPVPQTGDTLLALNLMLGGTGSDGNPNPHTLNKEVTVNVFNTSNQAVVQNRKGVMTYQGLPSGNFLGTVNIGSVPSGSYIIKISSRKYLTRIIGKSNNQLIQNLIGGTTNTMPQENLIVGDIVPDNVLDILDYNAYLQCVGTLVANPAGCVNSSISSDDVDLNDDGKIDSTTNQSDFRLLFRAFKVHKGD